MHRTNTQLCACQSIAAICRATRCCEIDRAGFVGVDGDTATLGELNELIAKAASDPGLFQQLSSLLNRKDLLALTLVTRDVRRAVTSHEIWKADFNAIYGNQLPTLRLIPEVSAALLALEGEERHRQMTTWFDLGVTVLKHTLLPWAERPTSASIGLLRSLRPPTVIPGGTRYLGAVSVLGGVYTVCAWSSETFIGNFAMWDAREERMVPCAVRVRDPSNVLLLEYVRDMAIRRKIPKGQVPPTEFFAQAAAHLGILLPPMAHAKYDIFTFSSRATIDPDPRANVCTQAGIKSDGDHHILVNQNTCWTTDAGRVSERCSVMGFEVLYKLVDDEESALPGKLVLEAVGVYTTSCARVLMPKSRILARVVPTGAKAVVSLRPYVFDPASPPPSTRVTLEPEDSASFGRLQTLWGDRGKTPNISISSVIDACVLTRAALTQDEATLYPELLAVVVAVKDHRILNPVPQIAIYVIAPAEEKVVACVSFSYIVRGGSEETHKNLHVAALGSKVAVVDGQATTADGTVSGTDIWVVDFFDYFAKDRSALAQRYRLKDYYGVAGTKEGTRAWRDIVVARPIQIPRMVCTGVLPMWRGLLLFDAKMNAAAWLGDVGLLPDKIALPASAREELNKPEWAGLHARPSEAFLLHATETSPSRLGVVICASSGACAVLGLIRK